MQNDLKEKILEKIDTLSETKQEELLNFLEILATKKQNKTPATQIKKFPQILIPYTFVAHRDPGMFFFKVLSNQKFRWVRIDPETYDAPYCCFFAVLQIWRLDIRACLANKNQHFTESLSPQIKEDIKTGKCKLILDYSNEGIIYNNYLEQIFVNLIDILQPAEGSIFFIQQNRLIDNSNSSIFHRDIVNKKIKFLHYDYFVKLIIDRITDNPATLLDPSMNYPYFEDFCRQKNKILLCLNATPRPHRIVVYSYIKHKQYAPKCLLSFHGFAASKGLTEKNNFIQILKQSYLGSILGQFYGNDSLEQIVNNLTPEYIDNKQIPNSNNLADDISAYLYKRSLFSVVTESDYDDDSMKRITEKTIKAFALGHPCIIVGNPHSLELAKDLGFRIFEDVINPEYDLINNPAKRLEVILDNIDKLSLSACQDSREFAAKIYETSKYNCEHGAFCLKSKYEEIIENPLLETISNSLLSSPCGRGVGG
jgi:hypothetical protein